MAADEAETTSLPALGLTGKELASLDVMKVLTDPNIAQQGLSVSPPQFKLRIAHGPNPADRRGDCHVADVTGHILACGPHRRR